MTSEFVAVCCYPSGGAIAFAGVLGPFADAEAAYREVAKHDPGDSGWRWAVLPMERPEGDGLPVR